ncbi:MAG TPA: hypothetical protein VN038_22355 [Dyadobacter sp.]|nr:hypothetical protein [Dyadobacter sp.]
MGSKARVLLDTNIWSYIADANAGDALVATAKRASLEIAIAPSIADEARAISDDSARKRILKLMGRPEWQRLMPEAFLECEELFEVVRQLRPHWIIDNPNLIEFNRLRYDWVRRKGGFWDRLGKDISPTETTETLRSDRELELAREESRQIRLRTHARKIQKFEHTPLQAVYFEPDSSTAGWDGDPIEYWRYPSLQFVGKELTIYASPYSEWLDCKVNVPLLRAELTSWNRLWLYDAPATALRRHWMRTAFEFLQSWRRVTDGNPNDSRLAGHLVDVTHVVSADKNFIDFAQRCHEESPFPTARPVLAAGGKDEVPNLLTLIAGLT